MKQDPLEKLLREPITTAKPRPGFEARLKTLAADQSRSTTSTNPPRFAWVGGAVCAALAIAAGFHFLSPDSAPASPPSAVEVKAPTPYTPVHTLAFVKNSPMHQEMRGLQHDAERTLDFLSDRFPSLPKKF